MAHNDKLITLVNINAECKDLERKLSAISAKRRRSRKGLFR